MSESAAFLERYESVRTDVSYRTVNGVGIFSLPAFDALSFVEHGFSARTGGVSEGPFATLNLSFSRPEDTERVYENYRRFCGAAGIDPASMVMDNYEHGTVVRTVDRKDAGCGYDREPLDLCDGLVTDDPSITLVTGHADCMAFFAADPKKKAVGLAHAGWRGALGRIGSNLAERMRTEYGSNAADLIVGVGPSICPDCFEVGDDVAKLFLDAFPNIPCRFVDASGKAHIDLWRIAAAQFFEAGVLPEHLFFSGVCTKEDERLFSYRRAQGLTGGMAAYLRLK